MSSGVYNINLRDFLYKIFNERFEKEDYINIDNVIEDLDSEMIKNVELYNNINTYYYDKSLITSARKLYRKVKFILGHRYKNSVNSRLYYATLITKFIIKVYYITKDKRFITRSLSKLSNEENIEKDIGNLEEYLDRIISWLSEYKKLYDDNEEFFKDFSKYLDNRRYIE